VVWDVAVTVALVTTAPWGSYTTPAIVPLLVCGTRDPAKPNTITNKEIFNSKEVLSVEFFRGLNNV
jgi:hypothetical protein